MNPLDQPRSYSALLKEFWGRVASGADKLALLTAWAEQRPTIRPARHPHAVRREHTIQRRATTWKGRRCFVCAERATQEHHIIQVQHGGTNRPMNKVWVCTPCHRRIHPHLAEPPQPAPVGIVPYTVGTEQRTTCFACGQPVIAVTPLLRKRRVSQSMRPILLRLEAVAPYHTTDIHQQYCLNKREYNAVLGADMAVLARQDCKGSGDVHWHTQAITRAVQVLKHG